MAFSMNLIRSVPAKDNCCTYIVLESLKWQLLHEMFSFSDEMVYIIKTENKNKNKKTL